jgi:hypothetical protein
MMNLTRDQEKKTLIVLLAVLMLFIVYRAVTAEKPRTAPLAFPPGSVAPSAVRQGLAAMASGADPLNVFLAKREEKFPGVARDIFRMENPAPKPAPKPAPLVVTPPPPPAAPERTAEEIAAEASRADLSKFRFLGYLTEKDNTLFLSKEGELFIVKTGDTLLKNYQVKDSGKDYVVLFDKVTHVEVRVELSGSEPQPQALPMPRLR